MSTYSTNLRLELIGTGEQQGTWGTTTNTNLGTLLEQAITGYSAISVTDGADTTLTTSNGASDQARNMTLVLTGTLTAARNVICPATPKIYIVKNSTTGGFAVTFKVTGQTGVSIPNGATYLLFVDGTDVRQATGSIQSGGTGASTAAAAIQALDTWQLVTSAAGTTTLTNTSPRNILVTGSTTQTIVLPDVSTLAVGWTFNIINTSSGTITVQSSGLNSFSTQTGNINASYTCISTTGTTTASWTQNYTGSTAETGSGSMVYNFAPAIQRIRFVNANAFTAGTNAQGQGALSETVNIITTAASNPSGVTLPNPSSTATYTTWVTIVNKGANPVNVYPASGHTIDALGVNNPISLAVNGVMSFWATSTNQWYSSVNTIDNVSLATGTLAVANGGTGVTTSTGTGDVVLSASPALTGTPTAPTAAGGTNTTQIATTAFVTSAVSSVLPSQTTYSSAGSGNWTIPTAGTYVLVRMWGGGGSGGAQSGSNAYGGGGGGYREVFLLKSSLGSPGSTVAYSVGAGGAAVSGAGSNGNPGGNTTFGSNTAFGGGGGGTSATTAQPGIGGGYSAAGGTGGAIFGSTASAGDNAASEWGGGNGGGGAVGVTGGQAVYGGGGGGGTYNIGTTSGGASIFGGAGGAGAGSGTATSGSAPGGGGGGCKNSGTSGAGGAGRIEIYVW